MVRALFVMGMSLLSLNLHAAIKSWQIVPSESSLVFIATQNNAPVKGSFKSYTGDIQFDKADLAASKVRLSVDIGSVSTSYQPVADTLKTEDWFNVKAFPQALFESKSIKQIKDGYQAQGMLSIRDKSAPLTIDFSLKEGSPEKIKVKGEATISRTQFGIGQGEWAATDEVKDKVKIDFDFALQAGTK